MTIANVFASDTRLVVPLRRTADIVLRYSLVFLLLLWGSFKFFAFEAEAIEPLVRNSPLLGWLYGPFGVRGTSALFGVFEVAAAVLIAAHRLIPRVSGYASLASAGMFLTTLSFLITTPNVFSGPWSGFLMKDVVLLGAALYTAAESLAAATRRAPSLAR
jgi:uncharacterized membrane protein YkgB